MTATTTADPRRKLFRADMAALAGIKVRSLGRAKLPAPDGREIDGTHVRPYWFEDTARAWLANRPGKGWRAGQTGRAGASTDAA